MLAYVRREILNNKEVAPASPELTFDEQKELFFEVLDTPEDFETTQGYNMLILHPKTKLPIFVMSIDFDFVEFIELHVALEQCP